MEIGSLSRWAKKLWHKSEEESDKSKQCVIAPKFDKPVEVAYFNSDAMGDNPGKFGRLASDDPRRLMKGLHHMKDAARWAATQPWLRAIYARAQQKVVDKMVKNGTMPEEGVHMARSLWPVKK